VIEDKILSWRKTQNPRIWYSKIKLLLHDGTDIRKELSEKVYSAKKNPKPTRLSCFFFAFAGFIQSWFTLQY